MRVGAVIVTYNPSLTSVNRLLMSIYASLEKIMIVDNGSRNVAEIKQLSAGFPNSTVLSLQQNKGIGFAQNRGIEALLKDKEIEAVVLFDHDSHPENDMIENLQSDYSKLKKKGFKVGAVGPVFIDPRTNNQYPIPVFSGFTLKKIYPEPENFCPVDTSFLIASGCFIPKETIQLVGLMNEEFFIDYIDIEWSFRAQLNGLSLYTCPSAKMHHQVGDQRLKVLGREISIHSPLRRYYLARNSILMIRLRYINWRYKVRELAYSVSRVFVYLMLVDNKRSYLRHILQGWYDGLRGRTGPARF